MKSTYDKIQQLYKDLEDCGDNDVQFLRSNLYTCLLALKSKIEQKEIEKTEESLLTSADDIF
jgi:hypothetical protein